MVLPLAGDLYAQGRSQGRSAWEWILKAAWIPDRKKLSGIQALAVRPVVLKSGA